MPFCTKCGNQVEPGDRFCRKCGDRQPGTQPPPSGPAPLSPRSASILCYVPWLGWLASVYVLASGKFPQDSRARFHAYQGLFLFVAWLLIHWAFALWVELFLGENVPLDQLLELGMLVVWILMLVRTTRGEDYELPIIGELARKSM